MNSNPFKLLGCWIGFVIGVLAVMFPMTKIIFINPIAILLKSGIIITCEGMGGILCFGILIITTPIIFFLLGWLIHHIIIKNK